jgi:hypothetical protein
VTNILGNSTVTQPSPPVAVAEEERFEQENSPKSRTSVNDAELDEETREIKSLLEQLERGSMAEGIIATLFRQSSVSQDTS